MDKNLKSAFLIITLMIFTVSLTGCNIFSWTHKAGSNTNDTVSLMTDGDSALNSGDYVGATFMTPVVMGLILYEC